MAEFQSLDAPREEVDLSRLSPSTSQPSSEGSRGPLVGVLLAVILLGGGYVIYRSSRHVSTTREVAASSDRVSVIPKPVSEPPPPSSAPATSPQRLPRRTPRLLQSSHSENSLTLQVAATDQVWVAVDADGKTALQRVLKPNDIQTFKARNSFDVIAGNAEGVILTLNGETLRPLGRRGEVKRIHITRDDLKNLAP